MTSENFTYWLKGYFEISNSDKLTEEQVKMIKEHLDYVFKSYIPPTGSILTDSKSMGGTLLSSIDTKSLIC